MIFRIRRRRLRGLCPGGCSGGLWVRRSRVSGRCSAFWLTLAGGRWSADPVTGRYHHWVGADLERRGMASLIGRPFRHVDDKVRRVATPGIYRLGRTVVIQLLAVVAAFLSAVAALGSATVAVVVYRGHLFELARGLHHDLTTGAVQDARNHLGHIAHSGRTVTDSESKTLDAYFRLLWCFERINGGREVMRRSRLVGKAPLRYLDSLITWHVVEWAANLGDNERGVRVRLNRSLRSRGGLQDEDSWRGFTDLVDQLGVKNPSRRCTPTP